MPQPKKVFVFDDNPDILYLCDLVLTEAGYEVKTSGTSMDIIAQLRAYTPHLILMDNQIPTIGGIQATRLIKQEPDFSHITVIYFSANNNIENLARQAGADDYLSKPFDLDDLEAKVNKYLRT